MVIDNGRTINNVKQKLFSLLQVYLCSNRTHRIHGGIMLALRSLNMLIMLTQLLCHDLYGYLFLISIIFALDVALLLIFDLVNFRFCI